MAAESVGRPTTRRTVCSVDGCDNEVLARGWCSKHYRRWRSHGDPTIVRSKRVDLAGQRFGNLVAEEYEAGSAPRWRCRCDCGKTTRVQACHLVSGHTKSCGCRNGLAVDQVCLARVRAAYRRNARNRRIEWALDDLTFAVLLAGSCHYCGGPPANVQRATSGGILTYSGIDRIDNAMPYSTDNCVSCCRTCNLMKRNSALTDFLQHVARIAKHQGAICDDDRRGS